MPSTGTSVHIWIREELSGESATVITRAHISREIFGLHPCWNQVAKRIRWLDSKSFFLSSNKKWWTWKYLNRISSTTRQRLSTRESNSVSLFATYCRSAPSFRRGKVKNAFISESIKMTVSLSIWWICDLTPPINSLRQLWKNLFSLTMTLSCCTQWFEIWMNHKL